MPLPSVRFRCLLDNDSVRCRRCVVTTYAAGVSQTVSQLPYAKLDRQFSPTPLMNSIDSLPLTLTQPNHVVIGSQLEYLPNLSILGVENPTKHFLGVSTANPYTLPDSPSNLGQVYLHTEEAYFVAGKQTCGQVSSEATWHHQRSDWSRVDSQRECICAGRTTRKTRHCR